MDALHQPTSSTDDDDGKKLRRREQNRLSAQRSYHKKQERISTLRAQVSQLESTYERHVNSLPREPVADASLSCAPTASSPACVSGTVDAKSHAVSPSSPPQKSSHMQQLLANRSELQHENDALRRRIEDHTKFQFRMQSLAVDDESSMDPTAGDTRSRTGEPRFQPRIQMKRPLSVDECYAIGSSSYQYIRNHRFPDKYMTSGSSLCGWRDRRVLENGLLKVELRKTFQGHDIDLVTRTSWAAVQDPHKMSALYSLNMNMQSEIVQRIDDNNTVMYQSYETPERDAAGNETGAFVVMHHVMLLTMFATDRGYVMIFCSLDPDRLDDSDHIVDLAEEEEAAARGVTKRRRKQWFKKFSWLTFQRNGRQTRDDAFELSYLFTVPPQHGAKHYWPLEIILLMMRFEMAAVGPVVLLPPSTSTNNLKDEDEADGMKQHATDKEENDDDDEDSGIVIIENTPVKIEPLAHSGTEDVGIADDDMSELFTELFP